MMMLSLLGLSLLTGALAYPSLQTRDDVQTAHLVFHGGPASYELAVKADGVEVLTSMSLQYSTSSPRPSVLPKVSRIHT
jgi:hypothetical protein